MKKNYVVSYIKELWINNAEELFIADPYIDYLLKKNKEDSNYKNIEVAEFLRADRESMSKDIDFIRQKYEKYIPILARRLNKIHHTSHSEAFWQKCFSMAFVRYLTLFYDMFSTCEAYFNPEEHSCQILSPKSYYIPLDFEDHRTVFQATHFGQEQIFSHYINLFYSGQFKTIELNPEDFGCEFVPNHEKINFDAKFIVEYFSSFNKTLLRNIRNKIRKIRKGLGIYKKKILDPKEIQVGILGSYFSEINLNTLIDKSNGKIYPIEINYYNKYMINKTVNSKKRHILGKFEEDFDRFDKFFFSTLPYCLPRAFVENFKDIYKSNLRKIKSWPQMKFVTSECWLSDTYVSIALATMKKYNIKHIYNEHNGVFHPFIGNMIYYMSNIIDYYVSFGWSDNKISNFIQGASLFPFAIDKVFEKKYQMLYVSYTAEAKIPMYGGYYGFTEVNAPKFLEFARIFMQNLDETTLKKMAYRGYPKDYGIKGLLYDKELYLEEYLKHVEFTNASYNAGETCKEQMLKARLVIIDYKSTAYLESLSMNIPTVFFWMPEADYLEENYSDFYQPLIDVGICQTDPVEAARFVEKIADNPEEWWQQEEVQRKKDEFLNRNFQKPQVMIDYLLNLV